MKWLMRIIGKENKERAGFTLVELMIVIIIVGVLAAAAVPIYTAYVRKARTSEAKASVGSIRSAEEVYFAEHGVYLPLSETVEAGDFAAGTKNLSILGCDIIHNTWWKGAGVTFVVTCTAADNLTLNCISATAADSDVPPPEIRKIMVKLYLTAAGTFAEGDWEITGL